MKHHKLLFSALMLAWAGGVSVSAETVTNYTVDFNDAIDTKLPAFRVSSNWKHIVGSDNYDGYGPYYMSYSYNETGGVGGSGCLRPGRQYAGDNWGGSEVHDLLVTPEVQGRVTLQVKTGGNSYSYLEFWSLNDSETDKGTLLKKLSTAEISSGDWITAEVNVDDLQRIGIRASDVYIDNFTAASAEIEAEPGIAFISVEPSNTTGVIEHKQNASGDVEIIYTVSVKNTGTIPLVARKEGVSGTKNYSISVIGKDDAPFGAPVYVPFDLAIGETSPEFEVKVIVPKDEISDWWSSAYSSITMNLRENLQGTVLKRANAKYLPYESKFAFGQGGTHSTLSISNEIPFGIATEDTTVALEVYNSGVAPLSIKSITLPEGFSTTAPAGESTVASNEALAVPVTLSTDVPGLRSGNLEIVYLDNSGDEKTYSVYLYGTSAPGAGWTSDFGSQSSTVTWPQGAFAEQSVQTSYGNRTGKDNMSGLSTYDNYLYSYTNSDYQDVNNKFITPLLTAAEGAKVYFSVARDKSEAPYDLKVYVSSDRNNWGEPVAVYQAEDEAFEDGRFHGYSIDLPAGDSYVGFAIYGMKLNDIAADATAKSVAHDLYLTNFKQIETQQSGKIFTPSVEVLAGVDAPASSYKVTYYLGDEALEELPGVDLTASANIRKTFNFSVSKEVESTVTLPGKVVFEFTDGTRFESPSLDIVITNEPGFVFNTPGVADGYYIPSSLAKAIDFGKNNKLNQVQNFEIFNWGTAPLQVTSITVPEGFASSIENATVAGKQRQAVDITFTASTPGSYSGNISIKYLTSEGEQEYTQEICGILLDPSKWYATFEGPDANGNIVMEWPAGSVYQKGMDSANTGTTVVPNYGIYATGNQTSKDRMFVTPLLKAEAGEKLSFDAKVYTSGWLEGGVKVYAAATRDALLTPDADGNYPDRVLLTELCGKDFDEDHTLTTEYATFDVTFGEAGNYYIGFEPYSRAYIDEIYGLSKVGSSHDLILEGANIPSEAMQNVLKGATLLIRNIGSTETAGSYTVTSYVNGVATSCQGQEEIPVNHKLSDSPTQLAVEFRSPQTGTFPVYFELSADDVTIVTDPVDVTFTEEVLSSEVVVGTPNKVEFTSCPINLYYKDSEFVALYTPADLGFGGGEKISSIVLKGSGKKDFESTLKVYYEWTDDMSQAEPGYKTGYETEGMTEAFNGRYEWPNEGEGKVIDMITLGFDQPLVYPAGKSLRILVSSSNDSDAGSSNFGLMVSSDMSNCYKHQDDGSAYSFDSSWGKGYMPVLYISLVTEERTVSGEVMTADGTPAANATVRLVSNDGDNVQYACQTNANGEYSVKVVQQGREYDVEAIGTDGKEDLMKGVSVADESMIIDFSLTDVFRVSDDGVHTGAPDNAVVYVQKSLNPGYNAVAFPVALSAKDVKCAFGEDVAVFAFDDVISDGPATVVNFKEVNDKNMEAGKPYLILTDEKSKEIGFKVKGQVTDLKTTSVEETDFLATDRPTAVAGKMFVLSDDNFVDGGVQRAVTELPAYSGYIKAPNATTLSFMTESVETGIEEAEIVEEGDDVIYDLNGFRVKNPEKGIYIINGKAVLVK